MVKNTLHKITGTLFLAAALMAACVPAQSAGQTSGPGAAKHAAARYFKHR